MWGCAVHAIPPWQGGINVAINEQLAETRTQVFIFSTRNADKAYIGIARV